MPYLNLDSRNTHALVVRNILTLLSGGENRWIKGEMFGYFVNRISFGFLNEVNNLSFNSTAFTPGNLKTLNGMSDKVITEINGKNDPFSAASELSYVINSIYWGFLGQAENFETPSYGVQAYFNGIISHIIATIREAHTGSNNSAQAVMAFRRHLVVCGILEDVLIETHHSNFSRTGELDKRLNGDIWVAGKLNVAIEDNRQPHEKLVRR